MNYAITQGRLSPPIDNKIQSFPQKTWKNEFKYANKIGLKYIEWVIDYKSINSNPIFHEKGINEINKLKKKYKIKTITIQCDFILHKPFWKKKYKKYKKIIDNKINYLFSLNNEFKNSIFIIPLLENSKVNSLKDENFIISYFKDKISILKKNNHKIAFEVDFKPKKVSKFIKKLDKKYFGINYDTGNSISNNFNYKEEIKTYFKRVINIHYKDKNSKNKSVYLGEGKFLYPDFYKNLKKINYKGLLTLQAARSEAEDETDLIKSYLDDLKNSSLKKKFSFGIMQGRTKLTKFYNLCPKNWEMEFEIARKANFNYIEMILDRKLAKHNPLMKNTILNDKIKKMTYSINLDYFVHNKINNKNLYLFKKIIKFAELNNFKIVVLPLIEKNELKKKELIAIISKIKKIIKKKKIKVALELMENFDIVKKFGGNQIGICYDVGNLSKIRNIYKDIINYKKKIIHFHFKSYKIKKRSNFSDGNINFCKLIGLLKKINYNFKITFEGLKGIKNNIINKKYLESII